jgi:hypothetical protein
MFRSRSLAVVAAIAAAALAGCGGSSSYPSVPSGLSAPSPVPTTGAVSGLSYLLTAPIAAWKPGVSPSYDISFNNGKFNVLADRTDKALEVVDDKTFTLKTVPGPFTGFTGDNSTSGPDGVTWDSVDDLFYVGDVNKVVPFNANTSTYGTPITIPQPPGVNGGTTLVAGGSGKRTDEGCYDPDDQIVMFANNADAPPYATFISTKGGANTIIAQLVFDPTTVGAEQCAYVKPNFYINNVGDHAFPGGALAVIPASDIVAAAPGTIFNTGSPTTTPAGYVEVDESTGGVGCNPAGLVPDKRGNLLVGCGDVSAAANAFTPGTADWAAANALYGAGKPLHSLIFSTTGTPALVATVPYGGSDEVNYDPLKDRFYAAARFWTTSGVSGGTPFTSIGVIDAVKQTLIGTLPTVGNVHSVAADPNTGNVFFPHQSTSSAGGGIDIYIAQ